MDSDTTTDDIQLAEGGLKSLNISAQASPKMTKEERINSYDKEIEDLTRHSQVQHDEETREILKQAVEMVTTAKLSTGREVGTAQKIQWSEKAKNQQLELDITRKLLADAEAIEDNNYDRHQRVLRASAAAKLVASTSITAAEANQTAAEANQTAAGANAEAKQMAAEALDMGN